jgi:hypothetical protein
VRPGGTGEHTLETKGACLLRVVLLKAFTLRPQGPIQEER